MELIINIRFRFRAPMASTPHSSTNLKFQKLTWKERYKLTEIDYNKVINPKKPIKSRYAHISALCGTTRAGPHWTASFSRGGPAAGGLFWCNLAVPRRQY